jgi:hypothetical protein
VFSRFGFVRLVCRPRSHSPPAHLMTVQTPNRSCMGQSQEVQRGVPTRPLPTALTGTHCNSRAVLQQRPRCSPRQRAANPRPPAEVHKIVPLQQLVSELGEGNALLAVHARAHLGGFVGIGVGVGVGYWDPCAPVWLLFPFRRCSCCDHLPLHLRVVPCGLVHLLERDLPSPITIPSNPETPPLAHPQAIQKPYRVFGEHRPHARVLANVPQEGQERHRPKPLKVVQHLEPPFVGLRGFWA